jgi:hypothetical protein
MLCCTILYYTILYHIPGSALLLYYTILYYTILWWLVGFPGSALLLSGFPYSPYLISGSGATGKSTFRIPLSTSENCSTGLRYGPEAKPSHMSFSPGNRDVRHRAPSPQARNKQNKYTIHLNQFYITFRSLLDHCWTTFGSHVKHI